jgi:hypothetical protein
VKAWEEEAVRARHIAVVIENRAIVAFKCMFLFAVVLFFYNYWSTGIVDA